MRYFQLIFVSILLGCSSREPNVRSEDLFQMELNDADWQPYTAQNGCYQQWLLSEVEVDDDMGSRSYYELHAAVDPDPTRFISDFESVLSAKEYLKIAFVQTDDSYDFILHKKDVGNIPQYARFTLNLDDEMNIYESDSTRMDFTISIVRTLGGTLGSGIEVNFGGVLYNMAEPADSLIVTNGRAFTENTSALDFNRCRF